MLSYILIFVPDVYTSYLNIYNYYSVYSYVNDKFPEIS